MDQGVAFLDSGEGFIRHAQSNVYGGLEYVWYFRTPGFCIPEILKVGNDFVFLRYISQELFIDKVNLKTAEINTTKMQFINSEKVNGSCFFRQEILLGTDHGKIWRCSLNQPGVLLASFKCPLAKEGNPVPCSLCSPKGFTAPY